MRACGAYVAAWPEVLGLNGMIATSGMSLFFFLSGFLIVSMLSRNDNVLSFLVRRVCRIVPLAWAFLIVVYVLLAPALKYGKPTSCSMRIFRSHRFWIETGRLFMANSSHFWSLCVEMQFYAAIALVVALGGRRGLIGCQ